MKRILLAFVILFSFTLVAQTQEAWQVTLPNGILKGTLLMPDISNPNVVLIIAGSGPTDRDGNNPMAKNNSLKMLAEALAKHNIASLRVDKRGIAASKMNNFKESDYNFNDFVSDAVRWIDTLQQTKRFKSIFVLGHSQGSLVAMLAVQKTKVAGYISLAGAGNPISEVLKEQLSKSVKPVRTHAYQIIDSLAVGKTVDNVFPLLYSLFHPSIQPFWISWMHYNPQVEIKKLRIPILLVNGTTDLQVSVAQAKLLYVAQPASKLVVIKGMNHILKPAVLQRMPNLATYSNPDLPLHKELATVITDFILAN